MNARLLAPLALRVRNMITRAVVRRVDDGTKLPGLQVSATKDETLDDLEHWLPYGFAASPQAGAEALMLSVGGRRSGAVIIACADRRFRLQGLAAGEVALHDDQGQSIVLRRNGIEITGNVTITGSLTLQGDMTQTGNLTQTGDATQTGNLTVTGAATVTSTLAAGGLTTAGAPGGTLAVDGSAAFSGDLSAGTVTGATLKMGTKTLSTTGAANVRAA